MLLVHDMLLLSPEHAVPQPWMMCLSVLRSVLFLSPGQIYAFASGEVLGVCRGMLRNMLLLSPGNVVPRPWMMCFTCAWQDA